MLQICRFYLPNLGPRLGQLVDGTVYDLTASRLEPLTDLAALLRASVNQPIPEILAGVNLQSLPSVEYTSLDRAPDDGPHLLAPADRQEIWAAGVTYAWSREARVREAKTKDVYVQAYEAERPELFFKSSATKAVGPHNWIGIRGDSSWNVPEPELTLVLNPLMAIIGYTVGNDVSSRDIEGANPLYLPQAKVYRHACAIGPVITIADDSIDGGELTIRLTIERGGATAFRGETSTAKIHRPLAELAEFLGRYEDFPAGALLLTGTGIVPEDDFTLQDGDQVSIEIEGIGILRNPVKQM